MPETGSHSGVRVWFSQYFEQMATSIPHPAFLKILLAFLVVAGGSGVRAAMADVPEVSGDSVIRCFTPYLTGHDLSPDPLHAPDPHYQLHPAPQLHPGATPQLLPGAYQHFQAPSTRDSHDPETSAILSVADTNEVHAYVSESGRFRLLYTTEGPDSVWTKETGIGEPGVPDYIVLAAQYADSSYRYQVEQLGYTDPLDNARCNPAIGPQLDVVFGDIQEVNGSKVYGYFDPQTPSRFFVNSTFSDPDFQRNDDDDKILGALKVTIAHELKHVIQYATNCFSGNHINYHWTEMDATMMENVVFPEVNDYYNYIRGDAGIFSNPHTRFPRAYSHVTFMLYYHEDFGPGFWVDVWDVIGEEFLSGRNIPMLEAMERVIEEYRGSQIAGVYGTGGAYGTGDVHGSAVAGMGASTGALPDLEQSLLRNYLWHLASGDRSLYSYGFSERWKYPDAQLQGSYDAIPEWPGAPASVSFHSARFFEFRADQMVGVSGEVALVLFNSDLPLGIGFLGKTYNGNVVEFLVKADGDARQKFVFPVHWEDLDWLGLVTMNTAGGTPVNSVQLMAGEGPAIERLAYGDVIRTGKLSMDDALWMLAHTLQPAPITAFDRFLGDVTGNGQVTPYDAARVLGNLDNGAPFPVDDNLNNKGPEWSRFFAVDQSDNPPAAIRKTGDALADTVIATLQVMNDQVLAEQHMDILLTVIGPSSKSVPSSESMSSSKPMTSSTSTPSSVTGTSSLTGLSDDADQVGQTDQSVQSDMPWCAIYLDLEIDFPPDGGGMLPGDPISLEMAEIQSGNTSFGLQGWDYDLSQSRLRLAFASSGQLASQTDPSQILTLRLIPENEGLIHFRIIDLKLDESNYVVEHPGMDTIRVMGPVFADNPGESDHGMSLDFALDQNYPNPFNPVTVIGFTLPEAGQVTLHVYDITGRRVATLADEHRDKGRHRIRFDTHTVAGLSSGVYLYRLSANGRSETRKMTIMK